MPVAVARSGESSRGSHGGYERRTSISASREPSQRAHRARTSSSAAAFELRVIDPSVSVPSCVDRGRQARARLDDAGQVRAHREDTARDRRHEIQNASRGLRSRELRLRRGRDLEREPVVRACVLTDDRRELCLRCGAERLLRIPRNGHGGSGVSRDRVAAHSAVERRKLEWRRLERRGEDSRRAP